ncbi:DNA dC-_dU-editing enzyme APOBEC-3G-like [Eptesicus fuscus]|uniref:DNA dC->dU-editing enzyme APOBEC-3G-like n=1 Tax=Eptesicus fuscus TaxID=29078 RepID=UPI0024042274|nr:DNA dC->dU-editing enzyme APOBEC-3G-like [Eptesicus fuscus]
MADNPAPRARPLMDIATFKDNFGEIWMKQTYLCYEVEVLEGNTWAPMEERQGFLRNQGADTPPGHAELCFLDLFPSWGLDRGKQYRLTWYISWSPCPDCAPELVKFLRENSHVSLRIFAARIYTKVSGFDDGLHNQHIYTLPDGYKHGLRDLRKKGAQLAIMTLKEHQHCWETFVDNQGQAFEPWPELDKHIRAHSQELENILRNPEN